MIRGLDAAYAQLRSLATKAEAAKRRGEKKVADIIAQEAIDAAPFELGGIQAGIYVEQTETSTIVVGGDKIAAYQEFGTGALVSIPNGLEEDARQFFINGKGKTGPRPFFFPAVFRHQDEIVPAVEAELKKILDV